MNNGRELSSDSLLRTASPKKYLLIFAVSFLFFVWMNINMPYCGDDWSWGLDEWAYDWLFGATINSRYAGNLLIFILTRSTAAKILIPSLVCALMPVLAARLAAGGAFSEGNKDLFLLLASYALFFAVPSEIWKETVGWYSGFANYVFSAFLFLIFALQNLNIADREETGKFSLSKSIAAGAVVFVMQMYLENLTVYMTAAALALFAASAVIYRRIVPQYAAVLFGALLGCAVMFTSGIYSTLLSEGEIIELQRGLSFESGTSFLMVLHKIAFTYFGTVMPRVYELNPYICPALVLLTALTVFRKREELPRPVVFLTVLNLPCLIYPFSGYLKVAEKLYGICWYYNVLYTVVMSVFLFLVIGIELFFIFRKNEKKTLVALFFWASVPLVMAPMAAINYIGWRSYYTPFVFMVVVVLMLLYELLSAGNAAFRRPAYILICLFLASGVLRFGVVYAHVGTAMRERTAIIEKALADGEKEIYLPAFPHQGYMISAEPKNMARVEEYRKFCGIPESFELIFEGLE